MDAEGFRSLIRRRIKEVEALLDAAGDTKPVELDQSRVGRLSRMDAIQAQALSAETERRRRIELSRLRSARKRLDEGEFGGCIDCGEPIAEKRLQHDPGATVCIDCARGSD